MEKVVSNWFSNLLAYDKNSIYSEKIDYKDWISKEKIKIILIKWKIIKSFAISIEKTAFYLIIKNDTNLWLKSSTKAKANINDEIINW
jgi:hypothetical protein